MPAAAQTDPPPIIVSNSGETLPNPALSIGGSTVVAQGFTTGSHPTGYAMFGVRLYNDNKTPNDLPSEAEIYNDSGNNHPGTTRLARFTNRTLNTDGATYSGLLRLAASTTYWILTRASSQSPGAHMTVISETTETGTPLDGATIRNDLKEEDDTDPSGWYSEQNVIRMQIHGRQALQPQEVRSLSVEPNPVKEGESAKLTVEFEYPWTEDVYIGKRYTTGDGYGNAGPSDYETCSLPVRAGMRTATCTIATNHDDDTDDETFTVGLAGSYVTGNERSRSVRVTIADDDTGTAIPVDPPDGTGGGGSGTGGGSSGTGGSGSSGGNSVGGSGSPGGPAASRSSQRFEVTAYSGDRSITLLLGQGCPTNPSATRFCEYRLRIGNPTWSEWRPAVGQTSTHVVVNGLVNSREYHFEVRDPSRQQTASLIAVAGLPKPPEPPSAAAADGRLQLHGPPVDGQGAPVEGVLYRYLPSEIARLAALDSRGWEATASGISNDSSYRIVAQAFNDYGVGAWSQHIESTPSAALPTAPLRLQALPGTSAARSLVTLRWDQGSENDSPANPAHAATGYEYRLRRSTARNWQRWTAVEGGAAANSLELPGLLFGQRYFFEVRARGQSGPGATSSTSVIPSIPPRPSHAPKDFAAQWAQAGQAQLNWADPALSLPVRHQYRISADYGASWGAWTDAMAQCEGACSASVSVTANGSHRLVFQLRRRGFQDTAEAWTGTHPDAPLAAVLLRPLALPSGDVTLRWNPSSEGNAATAWEYRAVFLDAASGSAWTQWLPMQPSPGASSGQTFGPVPLAEGAPSGQYAYQVRGTNAFGAGASSNAVTVSR